MSSTKHLLANRERRKNGRCHSLSRPRTDRLHSTIRQSVIIHAIIRKTEASNTGYDGIVHTSPPRRAPPRCSRWSGMTTLQGRYEFQNTIAGRPGSAGENGVVEPVYEAEAEEKVSTTAVQGAHRSWSQASGKRRSRLGFVIGNSRRVRKQGLRARRCSKVRK